MMGHREPLKGGFEYDGLRHAAKRFHNWRAGVRPWIKRRFNKRTRKDGKGTARDAVKENVDH